MKTILILVVVVISILCVACTASLPHLLPEITETRGLEDVLDWLPDGDCACTHIPANCNEVFPGAPMYGWPVPSAGWGNITAVYCDPEYLIIIGQEHHGIDISAVDGTPVVATMPGTVARAGNDLTFGMGWNVKIVSDTGWSTYFFHLQEGSLRVSVGQRVNPGDTIASVDNSGLSTGSHLHYEIHQPSGVPIDPAPTMMMGW